MRKVLILLFILLFYVMEAGFCVETYSPTDSVPLFVVTTDSLFWNLADPDSLRFVWYRALESGEYEEIGTILWESDSTWGKIAVGEIGRWVPATDAVGNPGKYQGSIRAYNGTVEDAKIVNWLVKVTSVDSLIFRKNPFIHSYGELLESFEDSTNWTLTGSGSSYNQNYLNRTEGVAGLEVVPNVSSSAYITKTVEEQFGVAGGKMGHFTLDVYTEVYPHKSYCPVESVVVWYSTTTDFSKGFGIRFEKNNFVNGWNRFVWDAEEDCYSWGAEDWRYDMIRVRLYTYSQTDSIGRVVFDNLRYGYEADPVLIFNFSDCLSDSQMIYGYRQSLKPFNIKATWDVICDGIEDTPRLIDSLKILSDDGHNLINHQWGANIPSPPDDTVGWVADVTTCLDYLWYYGFRDEPRIVSYPAGYWYSWHIRGIKKRSIMGVADSYASYQAHLELDDRKWWVKRNTVLADSTAADVKRMIDEFRRRDGLGMLAWHGIVTDVPAATEWSLDSLYEVCRYADSLRDEGELQIVTLSEYYEALESGSYLMARIHDDQIDLLREDIEDVARRFYADNALGTIDTVCTTTRVRDSTTFASVDTNFFNNLFLQFKDGQNKGIVRLIDDFGNYGEFILYPALPYTPVDGDKFVILSHVIGERKEGGIVRIYER